jgi:hypothetical protein
MNILNHLQELDNLIIKHTQPPVTAMLRNKLSFALEQVEAHSDAVAKQNKTLSAQAETIDRLMKENAALIAKDTQSKQRGREALYKEADELRKLHNDMGSLPSYE